jgi:hypothetical protein
MMGWTSWMLVDWYDVQEEDRMMIPRMHVYEDA